ncbi:hypothetical protein GCM10028803_34180 [Larkinella knui]|uniref:Uncharacterized protein n=1 Tax=Larkinella knui TaxID=2025310 RepID=A0A3P1CDA9_9BACT|nr:hypothetical protein [Larkinella knui]RRB11295.1 hypothetical protein EHT87_22660 [Larkinella knui]
MNLNQNPTLDQLIQILNTVGYNHKSYILYVNKTGDVHLSALRACTTAGVGYANGNSLQFVLDTFLIGKGYTGRQATQDLDWMKKVLSELNHHWACQTTGFA